MRNLFLLLVVFSALTACGQQDKSKRPSPPALVKETLTSGATISVDYSQPSLKGRTIGSTVEPMNGKVWRAGANEATVFESDKDVKVEGASLPAGKYALYMLPGETEWTIIFNKNPAQWGTQYDQNKDQDLLKVKVKPAKTDASTEKLTYLINKNGTVTLLWGNLNVSFKVQ